MYYFPPISDLFAEISEPLYVLDSQRMIDMLLITFYNIATKCVECVSRLYNEISDICYNEILGISII